MIRTSLIVFYQFSLQSLLKCIIFLAICLSSFCVTGQHDIDSLLRKTQELSSKVEQLNKSELIQSMSQRSLLTPSYFPELKALIARQAYNFWIESTGEKYVSHLNVYAALYDANKFLGFDTVHSVPYNQAVGHTESVTSIRFGNDPAQFYSAGSDGKVIQWSKDHLKDVPEVIYHGEHLIKSIDVSYDGRWILIVTKDQGIKLLDTESSEAGLSIIEDFEPVQSAVFMPDEMSLVTITKKGELKIKGFDGESIFGKTEERINTIAVSKESNDIYTGTESGSFQIWTDTLEQQLFIKEAFAINSLAISPDQRLLAIGREKGDVILWDIHESKLVRSISSHQSAIMEVSFSPDGQFLLTASRDKTVRIWDLNDGRKLPLLLDDHNDWVMTAVFDPTGKYIVSGSKDKMIRVIPTSHEELADRICRQISRNMSQIEWEEYVGANVPYEATCKY